MTLKIEPRSAKKKYIQESIHGDHISQFESHWLKKKVENIMDTRCKSTKLVLILLAMSDPILTITLNIYFWILLGSPLFYPNRLSQPPMYWRFLKQALTKAHSLHDSRWVGICNKSDFNSVTMAHFKLFWHGVNLDLTHIRLLWKYE